MRRILLAAAVVLAACGPAPAHIPGARRPASAQADDEDDDDLVCREERMTGTNVSRIVCRTQAEIDEERNAAMMWQKHPRNNTSGMEP